MQPPFYFDTSFLVPLLMQEAASRAVTDYVSSVEAVSFMTSRWSYVEFNSMLGIRFRSGLLDRDGAERAERGFETLLKSFRLVEVTPDDFGLARDMLREHQLGLRGGDALHLAIARNNSVGEILTLDIALLRSAHFFGVNAEAGRTIIDQHRSRTT